MNIPTFEELEAWAKAHDCGDMTEVEIFHEWLIDQYKKCEDWEH